MCSKGKFAFATPVFRWVIDDAKMLLRLSIKSRLDATMSSKGTKGGHKGISPLRTMKTAYKKIYNSCASLARQPSSQ